TPARGSLIFRVTERPLIAEFAFRGLQHVSAGTVRDTLDLTNNVPLNPNTVVRTREMIRGLLAKAGVQLLAVDTVLTLLPAASDTARAAYRLTFDVKEGSRLNIADVDFVGNQAFSDGDLRDAMKTKPEGFLWFRTGKYDERQFEEDLRRNLPAFYGRHGYIDFTVESDTMVVDPQTGKARLVVAVQEGPQYRLGDFAVVGATRFPSQDLEQIFISQRRSVLGLPFGGTSERERGEVFDRAALDAATSEVQQLYKNEGYLYAQVVPQVERVPATEAGAAPTVNVTWAVSELTPFYIDRVVINGNTHTHESVIRERLLVYPGDVYNEDRLLQSYRSIAALGFFETPLPVPDIAPNAETGTVVLTFNVKEKQTGSINFGTSIGGGYYGQSGGLSGFLGYSQPNLFGQAKQADLRIEYGFGRSSLTASYTDPSVLGTRNSASVSAFHTDDRYRGVSFTDGRYTRTGGSFRWGFPFFGLRWTRAFAGYSLSRIQYEATDAAECDIGNVFCQPAATASTVSLAVTRDTKNHPLFPTAGARQSLSVEQTGGPLGGDGNFQKVTNDLEWWVPVGRLGSGPSPIATTLGLKARTGVVFGDVARFPLNRFWLGGTQYGESLRGYEETEITPFGFFERNARGVSSASRLGNAFLALTAEYAVRLNDNISVSTFSDAGNIWDRPGLIDPSRLFRSAGFGATVVTPFGPIGFDAAYGFDRTDPGWKFHFKINQAGQ
ncbi:MAG: outer membrane protein assembly factor BamA, partial [Gemmatimonadetes bacterium]|nr:outer membrane protein assembly factor BamA [Gemmatimonadota bacterium]